MQWLVALMALAMLANIGAGPVTSVSGARFEEGGGPSSTGLRTVRGEVEIIVGRVDCDDFSTRRDEVYVVQDVSGREVRLEVGAVTRIHGTIFPGDRIIAFLSKNGIPTSIRRVKG